MAARPDRRAADQEMRRQRRKRVGTLGVVCGVGGKPAPLYKICQGRLCGLAIPKRLCGSNSRERKEDGGGRNGSGSRQGMEREDRAQEVHGKYGRCAAVQ